MVLVEVLDEGLHSSPFNEFLLVNLSLHASGVAGDTDDQEMGESIFLQ